MRCLFGVAVAVISAGALGACSGPTRTDPFVGQDSGVATADTGAAGGDTGTAGGDAGAPRCARQADCDDRQPCTTDTCEADGMGGGRCAYEPDDRMCGMGERCFVGRGCASSRSCARNEDCDDRVACTRDLCAMTATGPACQNLRDDSRCAGMMVCSVTMGCLEPGRCGGDADCDDRRYCNGVERCAAGRCAAGAAPDCADTDMCTGDVCNDATGRCEHPRIDPCGATVTPGTYRLTVGPEDTLPGYMCLSGRFGPVGMVTLATAGGGVQLTGFPVALSGTAMGGMFSVAGTEFQGGCTWRYSFTGSFTSATRFTGTWSVAFPDCDISRMCRNTSGLVVGTR